MTTRIALVALAALAVPSAAVAAQRRPPTVDDVLQRFADGNLNRAGNDAGNLLRQVDSRGRDLPRTPEEIRSLIEGLVEIALTPKECADFLCSGPSEATSALTYAAWRPGVYVDGSGYYTDPRGVPVPEAFDALVRIYETLAVRALASGGDDPFMEAAWRDHEARRPHGPATRFEHSRLYGSLRDVFAADPAPGGRGWDYALALFERSRPPCKERDGPPEPPDCTVGPGSAWCAAGDLLHQNAIKRDLSGVRPWPGPNQDLWERRCSDRSPWNRSHSDWRRWSLASDLEARTVRRPAGSVR